MGNKNNNPTINPSIIQSLQDQLNSILAILIQLKKTLMQEQTESRKKIYAKAKELLGTDVTPEDNVSDIYACVETVWTIVKEATGHSIGGSILVGTPKLYECLIKDELFKEVTEPLAGDIILSVTGTGNGKLSNGHAGIIAFYGILSNNSDNGLLQEKLSLQSWKAVYEDFAGFKTHFFRMI